MKKKFTMLLASLFLVMGTAWAQKLVTSVTEGKYYTLECNSSEAHQTNRFLGEDGLGLNGQSAKPVYLIFESTDGGYKVKSALTGKYLNQGEAIPNTTNKYAVAYSAEATTVWTIGKLADDATDIYLTIGDTKLYLNNNNDGAHKLQIVKHDAIGTGNACSLWEMREHEDGYKVIESIGDNITNLDALTDGSYVIFYNVGRKKYIYEGTHDHKLWMGNAAIVNAGHEYIFRVRKEGDKYAFMAVSGRYISTPLDGKDVITVGIDNNTKDKFTITKHQQDDTKWKLQSTNSANLYFDGQDARFVGWQGNGDNSKYEIKPVVVKEPEHALADLITTDENIIKWLNIKNVRSGKYATYEGESTKMTQKADNAWSKAFFYLTGTLATDANATVQSTVKIHNFATENLCAEYNSWTAAGTNWNIMASQGQNIHPGWAISKGTDLNNGSAWNNEAGGGNHIAYWNGNDQGSTWEFVSADYYTLSSKLDDLKKELQTVVASANTAYGDGNMTKNPITLSATEGEDGYLYCNAAGENNPYESDKAGVAALIDGKDNTFLHSNYSANSVDGLDHYIRVDMGEGKTIDYFSFGYKTRATNGGNEPEKIVVEGSNDGEKYFEITTLTNLPEGTGVTYASEPLGGKPYRYLRFVVKETTNRSSNNGHQFFALASFNLNKVTVKEGSAVKTLVYNNLSKSIDEAENILSSLRATEDDINGLKSMLPTIVAGLEVKQYPFKLTMNINDPVCYHIKSARSLEWNGNYYWTFENGKITTIVPNDEYAKDVEAYWFFMENPKTGQLQLIPFIEYMKPMGYTTVGNGNDKLTNNTSASGFVGTSFIFEANATGADWWKDYPYAFKPAEGGDNYVSNCNGRDGYYIGFWNSADDKGTRFNLEETEIVPSSKLRDLKTALAACTDIPEDQAKDEIGWYSLESYAAYSNIMTPARNAYNDATLSEDNYITALESLVNDPADGLEINMPQSGGFYRIKNDQGVAYLSSGTGTGRTQFKADIADKVSSIFYYDGRLVSYENGFYLGESSGFVHYTESSSRDAGTDFTFIKSPIIGKLLIEFNDARSFYSENTGNSNAAGKGQTGDYYRFTVEEVDMTPVISELADVADKATTLAENDFISENKKTALTTAAATATTAANNLKDGVFVKDMTAEIAQWNALIELANYLTTFKELAYSARAYATWMDYGRYTHASYDDPLKLSTEIDRIYNSVDESTATIAQIQEAIEDIEAIIDGFNIEEITPGFYYFVNYDYNDSGEYLSDDRKSDEYTQRILTTEVSAKNIFYYDGENLIAYASGFGFEFGICNTRTPEKMNHFEFGMAYELGMYTVISSLGTSDKQQSYSEGYWKNNNGELQRVDAANASGWDIMSVTSLPVTIGSVRHATFSAPVAVKIPTGVKAYTGAVNGEVLTLTEVESVIPANTPVILIGDAKTYEFEIVESKAVAIESDLKGNAATLVNRKKDAEDKFYTLQNHDFDGDGTNDGVAFKKYTGDNLNGFRAYVELPEGTEATALRIRFADEEGATGIESVETNEELVIVIYDLVGRRVQSMEKGIYIVNGKKVVVK